MEQTEKLLKDYTDMEKGAYIGAIASIATADKSASPEEIEFLEALADSAQLSPEQKDVIRNAAVEISGDELQKCLDILKGSDLRFPLITDLVAFSEADQNATPEEKASIEKIAQYLNINQQQFSLLNQFVQKTANTEVTPQQMESQGFLGPLGDKLKGAGINMSSLTKGLIGVAGPIILASLLRRGSNRGGMARPSGGGLGGGLLGGLLGGIGLNSVIGMLNGGRGLGSTGGLLSKILKGGI